VPRISDSPPIRAPGELLEVPSEDVRREPLLAAHSGSSKASPVVSCPLCLDNATALTTTLCGHVFCKEVRDCHLGVDSHGGVY
jgi:hypothetical protein